MIIGMQILKFQGCIGFIDGTSSKLKNLGIMLPMGCGSMGRKRCIL